MTQRTCNGGAQHRGLWHWCWLERGHGGPCVMYPQKPGKDDEPMTLSQAHAYGGIEAHTRTGTASKR